MPICHHIYKKKDYLNPLRVCCVASWAFPLTPTTVLIYNIAQDHLMTIQYGSNLAVSITSIPM